MIFNTPFVEVVAVTGDYRQVHHIRTVEDAERLYGKGSALVEGDCGQPGIRALLQQAQQPVVVYALQPRRQSLKQREQVRGYRQEPKR